MTDERNNDEQRRELLRREYPGAAFPSDALRARIERSLQERGSSGMPLDAAATVFRHPVARAALAAAAAILVFVTGAEYGRRMATSTATESPAGTLEMTAPLSIQTAGSAYVARLAEFSSQATELSEARRQEAREVALAILYAATVELLRESEDDDVLGTVAQLIFSRRQSLRYPEQPGVIWF